MVMKVYSALLKAAEQKLQYHIQDTPFEGQGILGFINRMEKYQIWLFLSNNLTSIEIFSLSE